MPNKIISDSFFITIGGLLGKLKGIIFIPLIVAAVGLDNYGRFIQILINAQILIPLLSFALGEGFTRYASKIDKGKRFELSKHFYTVIIPSYFVGLGGVAIIYLSAPVVTDLFLEGEGVGAVRLSSLMVFSGILWETLTKYITARKRFKEFSVYDILYKLVPYVGFVLGVWFWERLYQGILLFVVIQFTGILLLNIRIAKKMPFQIPDWSLYKSYFKFSFPLAIGNIEGGLLSKVDRYFIGYFLGPESIGIYNILYAVASFIDFLTIPIRKQLAVYLPKYWDDNRKEETYKILQSSLLLFLIPAIGLGMGIIVYFESFIVFFIDRNVNFKYYHLTIIVVVLGLIFSAIKRFYFQLINVSEKTIYQTIFQSFAVVVNIILNWILVPAVGLFGAGMATFASYFLIIFGLNFLFPLKVDSKFIMETFIMIFFSLFFVLIKWLIPPNTIIMFLCSILISISFYLGVILVIRKGLINNLKNQVLNVES